jgi:hypothetical protein
VKTPLGIPGARGSDVHTSRLIHCPVVADKKMGVAVGSVGVGQCDLCGGRLIRSAAEH